MKLKLVPIENFDKESIKTINRLIKISEDCLKNLNIDSPDYIEFYDELDLFIKRILPQVKNYGFTEKQAIELIKVSLNSGTYGTFDIKRDSIIEINFNPHFRLFYPSIHFLKLLIHESLHLFLYSKIRQDIYQKKFKFKGEKYIGKEKIIQLDEGFAKFLTDKILENFDFSSINESPIYSGLNKLPDYKSKVEGLNINKLNENFNQLYEENSKKGFIIIKKKFNEINDKNLKEKINKLIRYIDGEIEKLSKHK